MVVDMIISNNKKRNPVDVVTMTPGTALVTPARLWHHLPLDNGEAESKAWRSRGAE
jgi:hypothetical protein